MTHDDRVRHSWQKYDDRTASQSRPPMGRQFINCPSGWSLSSSLRCSPLRASWYSFAVPDSEDELQHFSVDDHLVVVVVVVFVVVVVVWKLCQRNGPLASLPRVVDSPRRGKPANLPLVSQYSSSVSKRGAAASKVCAFPRDVLLLEMGPAFNYGICYTRPRLHDVNAGRERCQENAPRNQLGRIYIKREREREDGSFEFV